MKKFSETIKDISKNVAGVKEVIILDEIGKVKAKLDSGNSAINAIIVDTYDIKDDMVEFNMFDKKYVFDIVEMKNIYHHGKLTKRPVIELDCVFNNVEYKKEKFSIKINDLHNLKYHSRVLLCKDFLTRANVVIDPSKTFEISKKKDLKRKKINESADNDMVMSDEDKLRLLELDARYHTVIELFRDAYVAPTVTNIRGEFDKFMDARSKGEKYYPQLEIPNSEINITLLRDMRHLKYDIGAFNCYLSKFYIERLESMIRSLENRIELENDTYEPHACPVSQEMFDEALDTIKKHPYKKADYKEDRIHDASYVKSEIEKALDDLDYDFDVNLDDNMLPRMNVKMDFVRINSTSKFSDEDITGLIEHEIKGHVGRRYYGKKTGLWLFAYGLQSSSTYDEGLAVWNSLNNVKLQKPNIMFNISLKTCISYLMYEMDFCDLFEWVKDHAKDMTDYTAFKTIIRPKRKLKDCKILGGEPMTTYFRGLKMVESMNDEMRDDILHYNIGPDQMSELHNIKKFLKQNFKYRND